jgi:coenzyme PQQ precursor peptide PqqA
MMTNARWQTPSFVEIDMSAEVGAYQEDPTRDERDDREGPVVERACQGGDPIAETTGAS